MGIVNCRFFDGYKPCSKAANCDETCSFKQIVDQNVLIIHLGALGSVVRTTALLRKIKKPNTFISWLTSDPVIPILNNHPAIDRLFSLNFQNLLKLQAMKFDTVYVIDKSLEAISVAQQLNAGQILGFIANPVNGSILPACSKAEELWHIGIDNNKKFFENKKTELQLIYESLGLVYNKEKYWIALSEIEKQQAVQRKKQWLSFSEKKYILGVNTGCSGVIPYKKLSIEKHLDLFKAIQGEFTEIQIVLLGGKEDFERNQELKQLDKKVINSDNDRGLRDGIISIQACDMVISGDSLGMHLAIALNKYTVAWFGPTCAHEIDMFDNGEKIKTYLACSPCWKRACSQENMCYDHVDIGQFLKALNKGIKKIESDSRNNISDQDFSAAHGVFG